MIRLSTLVGQTWRATATSAQSVLDLGRLAAEYIRAARRIAKLPDIAIASIWTWDSSADGN